MLDEEKLFYTISEASEMVQVKPYVLRYWETEFKKLNPQKSSTGQRAYRPKDIQVAQAIKRLLYEEKYTIAGAIQKLEEAEKKGFDAIAAAPLSSSQSSKPAGDSENEKITLEAPSAEKPQIPPQVAELEGLISDTRGILGKYDLP